MKVKAKLLQNTDIEGREYRAGQTVEMDEGTARVLAARGSVEPAGWAAAPVPGAGNHRAGPVAETRVIDGDRGERADPVRPSRPGGDQPCR